MSYKISIPKKDRIAVRFMSRVHAALTRAAVEAKEETGLTQLKIASELGVDKSVISRIFKGAGNPTIRTIGEISAAMGYRPELVLHKITVKSGSNSFLEINIENESNTPASPVNIDQVRPVIRTGGYNNLYKFSHEISAS